jgi:hypothetical protein
MKLLLIVMALLEVGAGVALLIAPAVALSMAFNTSLDTPGGLVVGRVAGAALVSLSIACWQLRNHGGNAAINMIQAMLFYNAATATVLIYAGLRLKVHSDFLWLATFVHQVLAIWCLIYVWLTRPG